MKDLIIEKFLETSRKSEEKDCMIIEGIKPGSNDYIIQVLKKDRVHPFVIIMNENCFNELSKDYDIKWTGYGEIVLLRLFNEIVEKENENWIVDTDVLNWDIKVGAARDFEDFCNTTRLFPESEFDPGFGDDIFGDEMVFFLYVQLNDYMS